MYQNKIFFHPKRRYNRKVKKGIKYMKNIGKVMLLISMFFAIIVVIYILRNKIDYDYTQYEDKEIFYQHSQDISSEEENTEITTYKAESDEEKKEKDSVTITDNKHIFLKDKLKGQELNVLIEFPKLKDEWLYHKCTVRISNAFIEKCEIELLYNEKNIVKIFDLNYNEKKEFKNGESFYIASKKYQDIIDVEFKFTITFRYQDERYKIVKTMDINSKST